MFERDELRRLVREMVPRTYEDKRIDQITETILDPHTFAGLIFRIGVYVGTVGERNLWVNELRKKEQSRD